MRKLVFFTVGFAIASFVGAIFYGGWLLLCAVIALILAGVFTVFGKGLGKIAVARLIFIGCAAGFVWFGLYDTIFVTIPRIADGAQLSVAIEAADYSYKTDYGCAVEGEVVLNDKGYRVKAYLNSTEQIEPGDRISGTFRFRLTTDGGGEDPTYHRTEGIFLLAYPVGSASIEKAADTSWKYYPALWRQQLLDRISALLPGEIGAFASALLLGDRSGISYELNTAFKVSGISHIIAVSGLHISILFSLLYTILARRRVLSCLIGIPVLVLFAAIAGFTPSVTRACIMQSLMLVAMVMDREYDGPTALAFAVLVMLVCNPLTVLSVSFQLSGGCMLGIFRFSEKIRRYLLSFGERRIKKERKYLNRLWQGIAASVSVSLSASAVTTPLVAYYFGCVSILGVVTNLLTVWVISFIFYGLLLCLAVSIFSAWLVQPLIYLITVPILFVLETAKLIACLPMAAAYTSSPYVVAWLIGAYFMIFVFLLQKKKQPKLLLTGIVFVYLLTQLFSWLEPLGDDFRVTMLDVGQGQSILLQSDGKTFLVDCGGDDDEDAADVTAEELLSRGISRLDGIIVTHYDADHAGGVAYLLSRIHTDRLIMPYVQEEESTAKFLENATDGIVEYLRDETVLTFGSTEMTLFPANSCESGNESSICVLFQRGECGILITGDRGTEGEMQLLQTGKIPHVDILVAGHHGSAGSTSQELLYATTPQYVFISVGENNRYGHPVDQVLQRLISMGCRIYRTDTYGTILFRR